MVDWTALWDGYAWPGIIIVAQIVAVIVPLLLSVAYLTYAERKVIAAMQLRKGPNVVGPFGLLQPIADGIKLLFKETILPAGANRVVFMVAPMLMFVLALIGWAVIPFDEGWVIADINVGILYLFAVSSLGVYGVIMAGWASNSKYPFLGALRSAAQMVSYEISMGFVIVTVLLCVGSLNLTDIVLAQKDLWFAVPLLPMFVIFFVSTLAETNRSPFDLAETESEIVAGFFLEYSSMSFALFFLAEYANMILLCAITTILFLGGWLPIVDVAPFDNDAQRQAFLPLQRLALRHPPVPARGRARRPAPHYDLGREPGRPTCVAFALAAPPAPPRRPRRAWPVLSAP